MFAGNNEATLKEYQEAYDEGRSAIDTFTEDKQINIKHLIKIAEKLQKIYDKFNFDIPDDVKEFLERANSPEGCDLTKYTAKVKQWLEENKQLGRYVIRVIR